MGDFSYNELGPEGVTAVVEGLSKNKSVETISLAGNSIGDVGATAVADAFRQPCSMTALSLQNNGIGPSGTLAVARMLTEEHEGAGITKLLLDQNPIEGRGM